jgi:hypothetical protein
MSVQARHAASHSASGAASDQVDRIEHIHRGEEDEAGEAGAGEIGEIDAAEGLVVLQEHTAEEHCAAEKRRQRGEEDF